MSLEGPNHALLLGELYGLLAGSYEVEIETEADESTGRLLISRKSGTWVLTLAPLDVTEP